MALTFYQCAKCGNIAIKVFDKKVPLMCCGQKMDEMVPGTTDAAVEKHVPVVEVEGAKVTVKVGSVAHPMVEAHYIPFIVLETEKGYQIANLKPEEAPEAVFCVPEGDKAVAAYEFCNLHGLWKTEI